MHEGSFFFVKKKKGVVVTPKIHPHARVNIADALSGRGDLNGEEEEEEEEEEESSAC